MRYSISILICLFITFTNGDAALKEHIREEGSINNNSSVNNNISITNHTQKATPMLLSPHNISVMTSPVVSEGGSVSTAINVTHKGREGVLPEPVAKAVNKSIEGKNNTLAKSLALKPVNESVLSALDVAPQRDDERLSVPKKGVSFPELKANGNVTALVTANVTHNVKMKVTNTTKINGNIIDKKLPTPSRVASFNKTSANVTVIHKKPLVTESDTDFINMSKVNEDPKETIIPKDQIDPMLRDKQSKRSDYIVPIVAVILSVPLVAVLASIMYKRGTYWWQHRNYKRMDFLIEGLYHN